jgi:hypothetical protein
MYKLSPEQVQATLATALVDASQLEDRLIVAVVLTPDPQWERIGTFERQ